MNVVVIVSDTYRRDFLGCYGNRWIKTPHLDRFAQEACVFENAYNSSFPTVPQRNDIMTGRYSFTYKDWSPLAANEVVLSECLNKAGVFTGLVADTPHPFRPGYDYQRGFQTWELIRGQENDGWKAGPNDEDLAYPCDIKKLRGGHFPTSAHIRNNLHRRTEEDYIPARTMTAASQWISDNRRNPFFLYVDTFDPHEPWDPPAHYVEMYDPGYKGEKVIYPKYDYCDYLSEGELKHCRAMFAGECSLVDRWTGYLLQTIDNMGLRDNTAVFFLSDHGFYLGEHGLIGKILIRDGKSETVPLYPEVSRIPFMVRLPGQKDQRRINALVQPADLMPTILDLMNVPVPKSVRSKSIKPVLDGKADKIHEITISSPAVYSPQMENPNPSRRSTVTDGRWLLVYGAQTGAALKGSQTTSMVDNEKRTEGLLARTPPCIELFDLQSDPGCTKNVLEKERAQARRLHKQYLEFLQREGVPESFLRAFKAEP